MHVCFEFLSIGARGDRSPYSGDGWAALPGLSSPPASHESWLIFIKASPHLFVAAAETPPLSCSRCRIHTCFSVFISFLYELKFHSVKSILANCSSRFNIDPNLFYFSKTPLAPSVSCSSRKRGGRRTLEETQTDAWKGRSCFVNNAFPLGVFVPRRGGGERHHGCMDLEIQTLCMSTGGVAKITRLSLSAQVLEAENHWASLQY